MRTQILTFVLIALFAATALATSVDQTSAGLPIFEGDNGGLSTEKNEEKLFQTPHAGGSHEGELDDDGNPTMSDTPVHPDDFYGSTDSGDAPVPEPATGLLLGVGLLGLARLLKKRGE